MSAGMMGAKDVILSLVRARPDSRRKPRYVFALPYLADYRRGFFDRLIEDLDGELVLVHPRTPINPSTRVIEHELSLFSEPVKRRFGFESQPRLVRTVADLTPTAIVVEANIRDLTYVRLLVWARLARVPVAIWGLGRYERARSTVEVIGGSLMTFLMVNLSSCVIGKGSGPAEYYARYAMSSGKVVVAPNSSGLEERLEKLPFSALEEVSVAAPLHVLFVGRLTASKGVDLLIRGLAAVDRPEAVVLHVVGEGPAQDSLSVLSHDLGVAASVHFHGNLQGDALVKRFADAHVLALPGKGGLVVPEALAAGLPLIVGSLDHAGDGTLGELLTEGINAFIAPEQSERGLRSAIDSMISAVDSGDFVLMQEAARDTFSRHGGVAAMSATFSDFLTVGSKATSVD